MNWKKRQSERGGQRQGALSQVVMIDKPVTYRIKIKVVNVPEALYFQTAVKVFSISKDHITNDLRKVTATDSDTLSTATNVEWEIWTKTQDLKVFTRKKTMRSLLSLTYTVHVFFADLKYNKWAVEFTHGWWIWPETWLKQILNWILNQNFISISILNFLGLLIESTVLLPDLIKEIKALQKFKHGNLSWRLCESRLTPFWQLNALLMDWCITETALDYRTC